VRTLAEDLGRALGTEAHLAALVRTGSGGFDLADAIAIDVLEALAPEERLAALRPVDCLLEPLPRLALNDASTQALRCGRAVAAAGIAEGRYRAYDASGAFIGVVDQVDGRLVAGRMMQVAAVAVAPAPQTGRST
jgi:tRNA pseudouridine55 synthase